MLQAPPEAKNCRAPQTGARVLEREPARSRQPAGTQRRRGGPASRARAPLRWAGCRRGRRRGSCADCLSKVGTWAGQQRTRASCVQRHRPAVLPPCWPRRSVADVWVEICSARRHAHRFRAEANGHEDDAVCTGCQRCTGSVILDAQQMQLMMAEKNTKRSVRAVSRRRGY